MKDFNYFDSIIRLLTPLIAVGGLLIGLYQFNLEQRLKDTHLSSSNLV
jgi:hypothetical protein